MKLIGEKIIENGIKSFNNLKERKTIRAIIIKNNQVLMLYSGLFNDYTFPGGGLKNNEDHIETLKRELKEEVGANEVKVVKEVGYTEEIRYGINGSDNKYQQISYYYLCEINDVEKPTFVGREKLQKLETKYVDIDDVIKHNEKVNSEREKEINKGYQTVLIRENMVLEHIKNRIL